MMLMQDALTADFSRVGHQNSNLWNSRYNNQNLCTQALLYGIILLKQPVAELKSQVAYACKARHIPLQTLLHN
jgi:hypothetical protein